LINRIDMTKITFSEINKIITSKTDVTDISSSLVQLFKGKSKIVTVLGFDIYKYSKYKNLEQSLIPCVFKAIYNATIYNCITLEKYFFQKYKEKDDFIKLLIDTGDGGFQIFENPIEALIFAIYFQTNLRSFNSFWFYDKLREIIGEITLRYALTTDTLYEFENNYYGAAIINNARIMSKDRLNRFLIDDFTIKWFDRNIKGIENIQKLCINDFEKIKSFDIYGTISEEKSCLIFPKKGESHHILNSDILRIGEIEAKGDPFSVYSFHCQVSLTNLEEKGFNQYTVTLGNLNSTGLEK
jgi:hypothetical protein